MPEPGNSHAGARVLVIEDNAENLELTVLMLEKGGYAVLTAGNAEQGIDMALREFPDLILMDIQLPGMDGLAATRELKADPRTCAIPVVALTALAMKGDEARIRSAGCDGYLSKPLHYQRLWATVAGLLTTNDSGLGNHG